MRKLFIKLSAAFSFAILLVSCDFDELLSPSIDQNKQEVTDQNVFNFDGNKLMLYPLGDSLLVKCKGIVNSVNENVDWLTAYKDEEGIKLKASPNLSGSSRGGAILIDYTLGGEIPMPKMVEITQTPFKFSVDNGSVISASSDGRFTIQVTSNVHWNIEYEKDKVSFDYSSSESLGSLSGGTSGKITSSQAVINFNLLDKNASDTLYLRPLSVTILK